MNPSEEFRDIMASYEDLLNVIKEFAGSDLLSSVIVRDELTIHVETTSIVRILTSLRDHSLCSFNLLVDICGVDYPEDAQRFRVVYHLLSLEHNHRIRVKVSTDGVVPVPSVISVYSCANWNERETWDMYGIPFQGHPDIRRLLTDYDFEGHPLRKDFPLTGYVEVRYNPEFRKVLYEPVSLSQDFRNFDFLSPWEGMLQPPSSKKVS